MLALLFRTDQCPASFFSNDNTQGSPAWQAAVTLGSNATQQNSQSSISIGGATAVSSGNTLTLTVPVAFNSAWTGTGSIFVYASDAAGATAGYTELGSWSVGATADVTPPSSPAGLAATAASISEVAVTWSASTDNVGVA